MNYSIVPTELNGQLIAGDVDAAIGINNRIREILYRNEPQDVELAFSNIIPISKLDIDINTRRMIIDFIFKTWREDKSWTGTVKPMKWLSLCYDFLQMDQSNYLKDVLYEYTSSTPSFAAQQYTQAVFRLITREQYKAIRKMYMHFIGRELSFGELYIPLITKFIEYTDDPGTNDDDENTIRGEIVRLRELAEKPQRTQEEIDETVRLDENIRRRTHEMSDLTFF